MRPNPSLFNPFEILDHTTNLTTLVCIGWLKLFTSVVA
jgi:hypothetical protein